MRVEAFEYVSRNCGFKPLDIVHGKLGDVLIAERFFNDSDMLTSPAVEEEVFPVLIPHWCTMWVLVREQPKDGQYIYHGRDTPQKERISLAVKAAEDKAKNNVEGQRFK